MDVTQLNYDLFTALTAKILRTAFQLADFGYITLGLHQGFAHKFRQRVKIAACLIVIIQKLCEIFCVHNILSPFIKILYLLLLKIFRIFILKVNLFKYYKKVHNSMLDIMWIGYYYIPCYQLALDSREC